MSDAEHALPTVLLVGNASRNELLAITTPLDKTAHWKHRASIEEAIESMPDLEVPPELVLLTQSRPGEIGESDVRRLQSIAPLAGIYAVLGCWCEGEARTGRPWLGVPRVYAHEWPLLWREELRRRSRGEMPLWSLPATTSSEERLLCRSAPGVEYSGGKSVLVVARSCETASALEDACRAGGFSIVSDGEDATAILWDTTIAAATNANDIRATRSRCHGAALVALVGHPRADDLSSMVAAGADSILAKPFFVDDLLAEIDRLAIKD